MQSITKRVSTILGFIAFVFLILECFILEDWNLANFSSDEISKLAISAITIISGIFTSFYFSENFHTRPVVFFLYCFGIAFFNYYSYFFPISEHPELNCFLFDLFASGCIITLLLLIYRSYKTRGTTKLRAEAIYHIPLIIVVIKYILIFVNTKWTIVSNPLQYVVLFMLGLTILDVFTFFIYLIFTDSRISSMTLRYLLLGLFYSFIIPIIITIKNLVVHKTEYNPIEVSSIYVSIVFLPILLSSSVFQYKSERINSIIRTCITIFAFCSISAVTLEIFFTEKQSDELKHLVAIITLSGPAFYAFLKLITNRFLSLDSRKITNSINEFTESLSQVDSIQAIYSKTAVTLKELFHSDYIFFYVQKNSNEWYVPYSDTNDEIVNLQLEKSKQHNQKKNLQIFSDGSFVLTFLNKEEPNFKVFIGKKANDDFYLPSEISIIQRYINLTHSKFISSYTETMKEELQHATLHSKLMDQEIQLAAYVQSSFYPKIKGKIEGWDVSYYCKAMAGVSGDLYDFFMRENKLDGVGIFDVSGHGISSGLVTMLVRNIIRQEFYNHKEKSLDKVMDIIDTRFRHEKNDIENFLTGILIRIDGNNLQLVNAAHPYPIIYRKKDNEIYYLNKTNSERSTIIGFNGIDANFIMTPLTLEPGDEIILYTDGINEAIDEKRKPYGFNRLLEIAKKNINQPVAFQSDAILEDVKAFSNNQPQSDDIALIILKKE